MNCLFEFILDMFHFLCICCFCRKPYKCDICKLRFTKRKYLVHHLKKDHSHIFSFEDDFEDLHINPSESTKLTSIEIQKLLD